MIRRMVFQILVIFVVFSAALFVPAGTLAWPAGWAFLVLFLGFAMTMYTWLYRHNPALLRERLRPGTANQQQWDKLLFPLLQVFLLAWLAIQSADANGHWSVVPAWLRFVGLALLLGSLVFLFTAFRENSYLSPVVRIQGERGHQVVSTGPYRYVRHPMYSAILIFVVGTSLFLGSAYGLMFGLLCLIVLARRAVLEERTLGESLPGYLAYTARVRYRLIPHIW